MINIEEKNVFTLVKYDKGKESYNDRCGDFVIGRESEMEILYFMDINEFANVVADLRVNTELELTLLINGVNLEDFYFIEDINKNLYEKYSLIYAEFDKLEWEKRELKMKEKEEKLFRIKQEKELEKKQKELRYKKEIEKEEKEKLMQLLQKYPNLNLQNK